jgi:RNA-splicing ligase RtcB
LPPTGPSRAGFFGVRAELTEALGRAPSALKQQLVDQLAQWQKKLADIKQEAPHAYKGIGPIVDTLTRAGIAKLVAELVPLMTIKG